MVGPHLALRRVATNVATSLANGNGIRDALQHIESVVASVGKVSDGDIVGATSGAIALAWMDSAFATIDVAPRLAAALACTSIPPEYAADVRLPWPTFFLRIPAGVVSTGEAWAIASEKDASAYASHLEATGMVALLGCDDGQEDGSEWVNYRIRQTISDFLTPSGQAASVEERREDAIMRVFAGVCIDLASRPHPDPPPGRAALASRQARAGKVPSEWCFELRRPVQIDCRPALLEHIETGSRAAKIQSLVRGHHKRQRCGPGGTQRKWIHIEPYWRGPEDAPIALRPHTLVDSES